MIEWRGRGNPAPDFLFGGFMDTVPLFVAIVALVILSGFFTAAETGVFPRQ